MGEVNVSLLRQPHLPHQLSNPWVGAEWTFKSIDGRLTLLWFDRCSAYVGYLDGMDVERIIDDIRQVEEMFEAPDIRPLGGCESKAR